MLSLLTQLGCLGAITMPHTGPEGAYLLVNRSGSPGNVPYGPRLSS
jgi:hypothetical protein